MCQLRIRNPMDPIDFICCTFGADTEMEVLNTTELLREEEDAEFLLKGPREQILYRFRVDERRCYKHADRHQLLEKC